MYGISNTVDASEFKDSWTNRLEIKFRTILTTAITNLIDHLEKFISKVNYPP